MWRERIGSGSGSFWPTRNAATRSSTASTTSSTSISDTRQMRRGQTLAKCSHGYVGTGHREKYYAISTETELGGRRFDRKVLEGWDDLGVRFSLEKALALVFYSTADRFFLACPASSAFLRAGFRITGSFTGPTSFDSTVGLDPSSRATCGSRSASSRRAG